MNTQGERLLQFIDSKGKGYSQQKLADSIGVSKGAVNKVTKNTGDFSGKTYKKLVEIHNINLNWLIAGEGEMLIKSFNEQIAEQKAKLEPVANALNEQGLTPEIIQTLINMAQNK